MKKEYLLEHAILSNWPYFVWLCFYFLIFWLILGASSVSFMIVFFIYIIAILFSFTEIAEYFWRLISGVRPLRTQKEIERLWPLFEEVYAAAEKNYPSIFKHTHIRLYIQEDMDINAYAFGNSTLVLTRGSIMLLNDDCLKGLMVHEFGHFAHYDTRVLLISSVANIFPTLLLKFIAYLSKTFRFLNFIWKPILFLNDAMLMAVSRRHEYFADEFALICGFGKEMVEVLYQI